MTSVLEYTVDLNTGNSCRGQNRQSRRLNKLTNLLSSLGIIAPGHEGSLQDRADDGQSLSCFELRSEGQETRVFHRQV